MKPNLIELTGQCLQENSIDKKIQLSLATIRKCNKGFIFTGKKTSKHVEIGNKWFRYICQERGLDAEETFIELVKMYRLDEKRKIINREGRRKAGFSRNELDFLETGYQKA